MAADVEAALQIVEPRHLRRGAAGQEQHAEHVAEGGVVGSATRRGSPSQRLLLKAAWATRVRPRAEPP